MASKTSKELFEEWRGKKVTFLDAPAIVVGYDVTAGPPMLIISTDINRAWGSEALSPDEEVIDSTIETPYKRFCYAAECSLKLAE